MAPATPLPGAVLGPRTAPPGGPRGAGGWSGGRARARVLRPRPPRASRVPPATDHGGRLFFCCLRVFSLRFRTFPGRKTVTRARTGSMHVPKPAAGPSAPQNARTCGDFELAWRSQASGAGRALALGAPCGRLRPVSLARLGGGPRELLVTVSFLQIALLNYFGDTLF